MRLQIRTCLYEICIYIYIRLLDLVPLAALGIPLHTPPLSYRPYQVVESTGSVMTPYMDFPQLLAVLLKMLHEGTNVTRREVIKVSSVCPSSYYMTRCCSVIPLEPLHLPNCPDSCPALHTHPPAAALPAPHSPRSWALSAHWTHTPTRQTRRRSK